MGWNRFCRWLEVMKRQVEPPELDPGSWDGTDSDPWWQKARADRAALQRRG